MPHVRTDVECCSAETWTCGMTRADRCNRDGTYGTGEALCGKDSCQSENCTGEVHNDIWLSYWEQPSCTGKWFSCGYASRDTCPELWSDG
ncbi:hypothetical protein MY10362_000582 [Beauveria mimosiformis]